MINHIDRLQQMPSLAQQVLDTWYAPNPGEIGFRTPQHTSPGTPLHLGHYDAFWGGLASLRSIFAALAEEATLTADTPAAWALYDNPPENTWTSLTNWMINHHTMWANDDWIHDILDTIWSDLHDVLRTPHQTRLICPVTGCDATLHPQPGGNWARCSNGHQTDLTPAIRDYFTRTSTTNTVTLREAARILDIPWPTLRRRVSQTRTPRAAGTKQRPRYQLETLRVMLGKHDDETL